MILPPSRRLGTSRATIRRSSAIIFGSVCVLVSLREIRARVNPRGAWSLVFAVIIPPRLPISMEQ